jgi:hypothetical protein
MIFCVTEGSSQNLVRAVHLNLESWVVIMLWVVDAKTCENYQKS